MNCSGRSAGVVADGEALVGQAEDDLGRHDEARQRHRETLIWVPGWTAARPRLLRSDEALDRVAELGPADVPQALGELARGAQGDVGLGGARVVDDLPLGSGVLEQRGGRAIAAVSEKLPEATTPTERSRAAASISTKSFAVSPDCRSRRPRRPRWPP